MQINFYSTDCPKCRVLKKKLDEKNINYNIVTDIEVMMDMGIDSVPMLQIDGGILMNFSESIKWINEV